MQIDALLERKAVISPCGRYRYSLARHWGNGPEVTSSVAYRVRFAMGHSKEGSQMAKERFKGVEIGVEFNRFALCGQGGVCLSIPGVGFHLTMPLGEAETLGDAIIACVRAAEAEIGS
jgi:hypothetical protein